MAAIFLSMAYYGRAVNEIFIQFVPKIVFRIISWKFRKPILILRCHHFKRNRQSVINFQRKKVQTTFCYNTDWRIVQQTLDIFRWLWVVCTVTYDVTSGCKQFMITDTLWRHYHSQNSTFMNPQKSPWMGCYWPWTLEPLVL